MNWETIFVITWLIWSIAITGELRMARKAVQEIAQNSSTENGDSE